MGNKASRPSRKKEVRGNQVGETKSKTKPLAKLSSKVDRKQVKTPTTTGPGKVLGGGGNDGSVGTMAVQDGKTAAAQAAQARFQQKQELQKSSREKMELNKTKSKAEKGLV